ncbi:TonB-dependent receptor domain-containing protein [Rhodoferax antarcticus]|uniref:TonB-dependent receptor domain-containing protein n=1 Tax=Rhodoferax antarcticus TaxID=81479 RepID=UPI003872B206|nr:hemoglobin/transferrin/lactoferrin receptor protein [Rhodoferax antarcticus]
MADLPISSVFSLPKLSLCLGLAWGTAASWAQTVPQPVSAVQHAQATHTLKAVVVSGSRVEQEADDVPATITTITAQDIANQNPTDLEDLLKNEVGVSVRAQPNRASGVFYSTGRGGNEGVNIRGLEGDQVRLQVDGVNLPATYESGPYAAGRGDTLEPEGYKRVEILRGASSTQFGSDGLAGAVSFLTKDPSDLLALGNPTQFNLKTAYASADSSFQLAPSFAFKGDTVQGMFLTSFRRGHETDNMGTNDVANRSRSTPNPSDVKVGYLLSKLVITPSAGHQIKLALESIRRQNDTNILSFFGDPYTVATLTQVNAREKISRDLAKIDYQYIPTGPTWFDMLRTSGYGQRSTNHQYGFEARSTNPLVRTRDTDYSEDTVGGSLQFESTAGQDITHRFVYGLDAAQAKVTLLKEGYSSSGAAFVKNTSFPDTDYTTYGAFVLDEINFGAISLTPGLRYDSFKLSPKTSALYQVNNLTTPSELSDSALSPKLGMVWRVAPMAQLFTQYAHGFRAPKPSQVNGGVTNLTNTDPYTSIGNPGLKPQTSDTLEIGLRGGDATRHYSVSAFQGKYKDFIASNVMVTDNTAPTPDVFQSINLNRVTIRGFEVRGNWHFAKGWTATAAYAHT